MTGERPEEMVTFLWEHLSDFQRLILIRILKPQSLTSSVRVFVEEQMGASFVSFGTADLGEVYEQSDAKTPLIFILSPGSHPLLRGEGETGSGLWRFYCKLWLNLACTISAEVHGSACVMIVT